ncbi:MAG: MarR family transcriptional regulator [Planctomycetota bacterium]
MPPRPSHPEALVEAQARFVAVWGQMGSAWGISRTMAEVHALLFVTGEPLNTDDVMERLEISRGNASMSVRALVDWGVVYRSHKRGDRKEYFQAELDVWAMFRAILRERMKREVDPLLVSLHEIRDMTPVDRKSPEAVRDHAQRLDALLGFLETADSVGRRFVSPTGKGLQTAATLLSKTMGTGKRAAEGGA